MLDASIRVCLLKRYPATYVDELLECYREQKKNYLLSKHRPNEVEGGRFTEASFRLLEHHVGWSITPLGKKLDTENLIKRLQNIPNAAGVPDSVRLHIPRTLRVIYDIRNKRDAAHLADGIDPNMQDATFVSACLDWVLAEFIRLAGGLSPDAAASLVRRITVRKIPAVEEVHGFLKTLNPSLGTSDRILLLLYHCADQGATREEISSWLKPSQRGNLLRTLRRLEHDKDLVVHGKGRYRLTRRGIREVESRNLIEIE